MVDKYVLGIDEFKPEEYGVARKFFVLWTFLTVFYLLYFTLCPLVYHFLYTKRDAEKEQRRGVELARGQGPGAQRDQAQRVVHLRHGGHDRAV